MDAIGGYFELADFEEGGVFPYLDGVLLNTGRNSLEYILRSIGSIKCVYLPFYTCNAVLEPIKKLHVPWSFYHINKSFEIVEEFNPKEGEYIIANNYYGIKDAYIQKLAAKFGDQLIVDNAQAFFAKPLPGIKSFYSVRKFVGVADGGVAYLGNTPNNIVEINEIERTDDHDNHLHKRKQFGAEAGFADFQSNEKKLDNQPIRWMSLDTKKILSHIDFNRVITLRRANYKYLHGALSEHNQLVLPEWDTFSCPMVYPFVHGTDRDLRKELIENKVFVAKYWPNVDCVEDFEIEYGLVNGMIPIPCDQRYGVEEMKRIIDIIKK